MTWSLDAMLGSTVDFGLRQYLAFGRITTHFPRRCGLGFGRFCLRSHAEWRSMLSRCFDLSPCTRCSPLEYGHYFYEWMCWNLLDDEGIFPAQCAFFGLAR